MLYGAFGKRSAAPFEHPWPAASINFPFATLTFRLATPTFRPLRTLSPFGPFAHARPRRTHADSIFDRSGAHDSFASAACA